MRRTGDAALVLGRELLRAIDGRQVHFGPDPTLAELAADIGIAAGLSEHLAALIEAEVAADRVSYEAGRYRLTEAGRLRINGVEKSERADRSSGIPQ